MKKFRKLLCVGLAAATLLSMSVSASADTGASDDLQTKAEM